MLGKFLQQTSSARHASAEGEDTKNIANIRTFPSSPGSDDDDVMVSPQSATGLIGGSGISLDGKSLILPPDGCYDPDDVSSINTSNYGGAARNELRILGVVDQDVEMPRQEAPIDRRPKASTTVASGPSKGSKKNRVAQANGYDDQGNSNFGNGSSKANDATKEDNNKRKGWVPHWIAAAPYWLKMVILATTVLLVGALILISVGAALASKHGSTTSSSKDLLATGAPTLAPNGPPSFTPDNPSWPFPAPSISRPPTIFTIPTSANGSTNAPSAEEPKVTLQPTVARLTLHPTSTPVPTIASFDGTVRFYATAGRFTGGALASLPNELASLPQIDGNTFMVDLGDWNSPYATSCVQSSYQSNAALYSRSRVPVYFVMGSSEYNGKRKRVYLTIIDIFLVCVRNFFDPQWCFALDCPNPTLALDYWYKYNLNFETKYWPAPTAWNVTNQTPDYPENFAFVYSQILFIGIDLVGGTVLNATEWTQRQNSDLQWIDDQYTLYGSKVKAMVIFAHSDPTVATNAPFFQVFYQRVQNNYKTQVIYIHRNLGMNPWALQPQFNNIANLIMIVVQASTWPPMKISINPTAGIVDIDQSTWYSTYMNGGGIKWTRGKLNHFIWLDKPCRMCGHYWVFSCLPSIFWQIYCIGGKLWPVSLTLNIKSRLWFQCKLLIYSSSRRLPKQSTMLYDDQMPTRPVGSTNTKETK